MNNIVEERLLELNKLGDSLDLAQKEVQIKKIEEKMMEPNFWNDHNSSQNYVQQLNQLRKVVETFKDLKERFTFVEEGIMLLKEEMDQEFYDSMLQEVKELEKEFDAFSILVLLNKDYDQKNAIIEIHPVLEERKVRILLKCCTECIQDGHNPISTKLKFSII